MRRLGMSVVVLAMIVAAPSASALPPDDNTVSVGCSPTPAGRLSSYWPSAIARWDNLIVAHASRHRIDPDLVAAVIMSESSGNPDAISPAGATGLMQVMPKEAGFATRPDSAALRDPNTNLSRGVSILNQVLVDSKGDLRAALGAYVGGWRNHANFTPQEYADKVLGDYARALSARHCLPESDGLIFLVGPTNWRPITHAAHSGMRCWSAVVEPAYKACEFAVYPMLTICAVAGD